MAIHIVGMFCDDIREEKSGQTTIVGVLPDNVNIPPRPPGAPQNVPAIMPKLGLYVRILIAPDDDVATIKVKLLMPDNTEIDVGSAEPEVIDKAKRQAKEKGFPIAGIITNAVMHGFRAPAGGTIYGVVDVGDKRHTVAVLNLIPGAGKTPAA